MDKLTIKISARTDVGMVRDHNEDNFVVAKDIKNKVWLFDEQPFSPGSFGTLLMIADGMGGTNAGEVASELAVEGIKEYFNLLTENNITTNENIKNTLIEALKSAHNKIINHARLNPETAGMGTTCILAWIINNKLYLSWSGDSRAYLFRPEYGLKQLSVDHSYVQDLVNKGKITKEQAFYHPESNIITQCLGDNDHPPKPDFLVFDIAVNDRILLCTDGLSGLLEDSNMEEILKNESDISNCTKILIEGANKAGGHDNITLILCEILEGPEINNSVKTKQVILPVKKKNSKGKIITFVIIIILILAVTAIFSGIHLIKHKKQNIISIKDTSGIKDIPKVQNSNTGQFSTPDKKQNINNNKAKKQNINLQSKQNFPSRDDIVKIKEIAGRINTSYNKVLTSDSINNAGFKSSLSLLLNLKPEKNYDKTQICSSIDNLLSFKKNMLPSSNKNFDEAIKELMGFKSDKCK